VYRSPTARTETGFTPTQLVPSGSREPEIQGPSPTGWLAYCSELQRQPTTKPPTTGCKRALDLRHTHGHVNSTWARLTLEHGELKQLSRNVSSSMPYKEDDRHPSVDCGDDTTRTPTSLRIRSLCVRADKVVRLPLEPRSTIASFRVTLGDTGTSV